MTRDMSYNAVMARKNEIMMKSIGVDYSKFESGGISFDYEKMMRETGYSLQEIQDIQSDTGVGNTPLIELKNITRLARKLSKPGYGARIFLKDEQCNPSGSFKDRRAATAVYHAQRNGFKGVASATSGNYGAAVASQAAMRGLKCIVVQECYDSRKIGQPEIIEKQRKCESFGAEVVQLTVGPELFYIFLKMLEMTGYFNASLYTPFGIAGVETLGYELSMQCREMIGKDPDAVVITHAGGGNVTGTARGLIKAGASHTKIIGASVDLKGLHMASDRDFNRKSFTTGHTGFGIPFTTWPDRSDVPRSAARPLRYLDRYVTITQGSVFYTTEALAQLEGLERGPAGNTSLTAAIAIAQEMLKDQVIVVQETEYTGAGKHPMAQLSFAKKNGVDVKVGDPKDEIPGSSIVIPSHPSLIKVTDQDMDKLRKSYIRNCADNYKVSSISSRDMEFLEKDTKASREFIIDTLSELNVSVE